MLQHLPEYLPGHCHLSKLKHQPPGMPHQTSTHPEGDTLKYSEMDSI